MKSLIKVFVSAALLLLGSFLFSQENTVAIHYNGNFVSPGDTVHISATMYRGNLLWQSSVDGIVWTNLSDITTDEFDYVVDENTWFRAVVSEGDCEPYYSTPIKIHTIILYDNVICLDTVETILMSDSTELSNGIYSYQWPSASSFFTIGDILIGYEGYGYMRKVTSVSQNGDEWVAHTEQATLEDVIKEIDMEDSLQIFLNGYDEAFVDGKAVKVSKIYFHPGVSLDAKYNLLSLNDVSLISTNYFSATIVNGSLDFNPIFHRALKVSWNPFPNLDYLKMSVGGNVEFNLDLQFNASAPYSEQEEVEIFYVEVPVFNIGPIPIVAYVAINIGYETQLDITGITEVNLDSKTGMEVGIEYDNGWNNIYEKTFDFNADLDWAATAAMGARAYIRPEAGLKIVGFASGYMDVEPYLRAEAGVEFPDYNWYYGLYGGFDAGVGCDVSILGFNLFDYHYTFANYEWEIFSSNGTLDNKPPYSDFSFEQVSTYSGPGYMVKFTDKTRNNPSSFTWRFGDNETSEFENPYHIFQFPGQYEISLTSNNCYGSHTTNRMIYVGPCFGVEEVLDIDGNSYRTVQIGNQCWLGGNLKTTNYNDGSPIAYAETDNSWSTSGTGAYCWYENNEAANKNVFGALYNFNTVNSGKICPVGWHVPTPAEWTSLKTELGTAPADKLREEGIFYWSGDNATSTNESGFSARASGYRATTGYFYSIRDLSSWWTSNLITAGVANSRTIWYHDDDFDYVTSNSTGNGYSVRCIKDGDSPVFKPLIETIPAFGIIGANAISGGIIKNDGNGSISDKGLVWSSLQYPTIESNEGQISAGSGNNDFEVGISGLTLGNVYWYRAYAVNESGVSYGKMIGITAGDTLQPCPDMPVLTDADGNQYQTVLVGCDCWMAENLKVTKYNSNLPLQAIVNSADWANADVGAYSIYPVDEHPDVSTDQQMKDEFGLLYNWYAVESDSICPDGWHVSTNSDWQNLYSYLGICIGDKLRINNEFYWTSGNANLNIAGFSAKGAGKRSYDGIFSSILEQANWWTSDFCDEDMALSRTISYNDGEFDRYLSKNKNEGFSVRCVQDTHGEIVLPLVSVDSIYDINLNSAVCVATVISDGYGTLSERGLVWGTTPNPDVNNNLGETNNGTNIGSFSINLSSLLPNTIYYVRSYATNEAGTAYSIQKEFYTTDAVQPCAGIPYIYDVDGNEYPTVQIANQCWMTKNLRTTKLNDNTTIVGGLDNSSWSVETQAAYSVYPFALVAGYSNEEQVVNDFGYLYNFAAANNKNLCPLGWHVSTNAEWQSLAAYLGLNPSDKLRESGTDFWTSPNTSASNISGFSARGAGYRSNNGDYLGIKNQGVWWTSSAYSSTVAFSWGLFYNMSDFDLSNTENVKRGQSVRCVKNE